MLVGDGPRHCPTLVRGGAEGGGTWAVFWAAGTAVTSSPAGVMDTELRQMGLVLSAIARATVDEGSTGPGCIFFASSAGGVYGGSSRPPFMSTRLRLRSRHTVEFKLDAERVLESFTRRTGISTAVGRIANLYGPGQRLDKMQGLISHLARAQYSATPTSLYVPLDTLRDYVYVDDCAALIGDLRLRASRSRARAGPLSHKNVISGQAVSISALLGYFRTVAKGHPHVMLASSTAAALQAIDLRLASVQWPELDVRDHTPLPAGIHATMADILPGSRPEDPGERGSSDESRFAR